MDLKFFEKLTNLPGVSGREKYVREFMREEISKLTDEIVQDNLGSIMGVSKGKGPVIMIAGHMDEVGAIVTMVLKTMVLFK